MASNAFYELLNGGAVEGDTAENLRSNATTGVVQITGPAQSQVRQLLAGFRLSDCSCGPQCPRHIELGRAHKESERIVGHGGGFRL